MSTASRLEEAARAAVKATVTRDRLIGRRRAEGATLRQIAEEAGLSHTAVAKILSRS